jgi:hypothetical protein
MSEIRFSYNPFTKDFIESDSSHAIAIANKGKTKQYDEYIRGIIKGNDLYLRTYYPFDDLADLNLVQLKQKSYQLLLMNKSYITDLIKEKYGIDLDTYQVNIENDLLEGLGLANI